jgi:hypothetical protein
MSQPATVAASEANTFMLNGAHLSVSLMPIIARDQQLIYQDRHTHRVFRGDEIHADNTSLGFQITVILSNVPDVGSTTFTCSFPQCWFDPANQHTYGPSASPRYTADRSLYRPQLASATTTRPPP